MKALFVSMSIALAAFQPYTLRTFDGKTHDAEIATLGDLSVIRLRSTSPSPSSPIVFLSPGPGIASSVLGRVPVYFALFDKLRATSDVILLDARGEGMSKPNLDECPAAPLPDQPFESEASLVKAMAASVKHCASYWRKKGVDLDAFTTDGRADDVERLRKALGAERVNLLAFSYGTEVARNLLRRYPQSIDRAVLAGTDENPVPPSVFDAQLFKLGLADTATKLLAQPRQIIVDGHTYRVGKAAMQLIMTTKLADSSAPSIIPKLADDTTLQPIVKSLVQGLKNGMTLVGRAIDCTTPRGAVLESTSILGNARSFHLAPQICATFKAPAKLPPPLLSNAPVLFISGTLDANAPPFVAERIRWGLPNAKHVVIDGGFHETLPRDDVQQLVVDWFKSGSSGADKN